MPTHADWSGGQPSYPWADCFASDATPSVSLSTTVTEYSLPGGTTGVGRWSAGLGADLLEERVRRIVAQKTAAADQYFCNHQHQQALSLYLEARQEDPEQPRIHFMAGLCAWNIGHHEEAGRYLREALRLRPDQPIAHHGLADWCLDNGDFAGALDHSERAIELGPGDPHFVVSRASILEACGRRQEAWTHVQRLLATSFRSAKMVALFARLAPGTGQENAALDLINQQLVGDGLAPGEHRMLRMAAASILDRIGRFEEAFAFAESAHGCEPVDYNPIEIEHMVDRQIEYFTPAKLHDLPRASHGSRRPVFVIGMPRSGTSLVEQILASHPQIFGAGELTEICNIADRITGIEWGADAYPQCFDMLSVRAANKHALAYLESIRKLNANATFVIDKMPTNFLDLGVISTLFPDAHVIHCTRDPLDTCLSCYFTHFAIGHEHARNLRHLGAYYTHYRRLTEHWRRTLNTPMLEVRYEDVVRDLPGQSGRMLEFLGLPWDNRCVQFHKTERMSTTASRNQVNQPIYSRSVGRWRRYERHLGPLRKSLGECIAV